MLRIAARIAPTAVTLRGLRSEATEVAAQLLDLVDDALVSQALGADENGSNDLAINLSRVAGPRLRTRTTRPAPTERRLLVARYMRIVDFLSPAEHQQLLEYALACEADFQESGIVGRHSAAAYELPAEGSAGDGETVRRGQDRVHRRGMTGAVAGIVDEHELGALPRA